MDSIEGKFARANAVRDNIVTPFARKDWLILFRVSQLAFVPILFNQVTLVRVIVKNGGST